MKVHSKGFTIIELLMVITVIAIITVIAVPEFIDFRNDAKTYVTKERLLAMKRAIAGDSRQISNGQHFNLGFEAHLNLLPTALSELITQGAFADYNPFTKQGWRGPYLSDIDSDWNKDAWGSGIDYKPLSREIISFGPDGVSGNSDDLIIKF